MFDAKKFVVLSLTGNHKLDEEIIGEIDNLSHARLKFSNLNMGRFPDGETDVRIPNYEKVKDKHVILMQSAYNRDLMIELLDISWAVKFQYKAKSVTAVIAFMHYRRQDPTDPAEINRSLWFAHNLKANGVDNVIFCDIHSQSTLDNCESEGLRTWNVDPARAYARRLILPVAIAQEEGRGFYIYCADKGTIKRAKALAELLRVKIAINLKLRNHDGSVERVDDDDTIKKLEEEYGVDLVVADKKLANASFCIRDDELSTGGTAVLCADKLVNEIGAYEVFFCATHAVCSPGWKRKIIDKNPFNNIFLGDTIPREYFNSTGGKITNVHMAEEIAHQIILVVRNFS
jgi:ribose-phosphate pyrophosphokinase